ncbi:DNA polymerase II large subunit, partial [Candidatus Bathyarchaeota archaeon]
MFPNCSKAYAEYFNELELKLKELFKIAEDAKSRNFDPKSTVEEEIRVARDFADRIEYMVGPPGVGKRIRELSHMKRVPLAFKIAEEILYGGFGNFETEEAAEQAVKTGTAILTEGVTAAPIQGIVKVAIKQRQTDTGSSKYLAIYFAGPVRSAGGTELALIIVLGDYIRRLLGLDLYKASEEEVYRFIEELRLYEREVSRFQFHVDDETIAYILRHLPVEVTGIKTDPVEVSSFRDIPTIETNAVRGGALRVVNDGIAGRASKVWKVIDELNLTGWDWLKNIVVSKNEEVELGYLQDIIAGRPVFSFPSSSKHGGRFRLRYGRARNTGLTCVGIHPATMIILDGFIAVGTQLRLEMPGKGGIVSTVETIEPPIVRLKNGSVVRVETVEQASQLKNKVEKILFLGDLLISFSEFFENEKPLVESGYVEEWWIWDFKNALKERYGSVEATSKALNIQTKRLEELLNNFLTIKPTAFEAVKISSILHVPLHPRYTYFWRNITFEEFFELRKSVLNGKLEVENGLVKKLTLNFDLKTKLTLDKLLLPHEVSDEKIVIVEDAASLVKCLGVGEASQLETQKDQDILRLVSRLAGFEVKNKFPCFI